MPQTPTAQLPSPTEFMQSRAPQPPPTATPSPTEFMQSRAPQPPPDEYSLSGFAGNVADSGMKLLGGVASMITSPIETVKSLTQLGLGAVEKVTGPDSYAGRELETRRQAIGLGGTNPIDDVIEGLKQRYNGLENLKKTAYNDPVGLFADIAALMSGVGGALETAGTVSKVAKVARVGEGISKVSRFVDPLNAAGKVAASVGGPVARAAGNRVADALGITTGAGSESVRTAFLRPTDKFLEAMRGHIDIEEIVDNVKAAVGKLRSDASTAYQSSPAHAALATTTVDASPVVQRLTDELDNFGVQLVPHPKRGGGFVIVPHFDGPLNKIADAGAQQEVRKVVREVFNQPTKSAAAITDIPADHMDALKQRLDSFYNQSSEARKITASVRSAVRDTLSAIPDYNTMTKDYESATHFIKDFESEFSTKSTTAKGTAVRKLSNALGQNNDYRKELLDAIDAKTGAQLKDQVAGYAFNRWAPRGLMRTVAGAQILYGIAQHMGMSKLLDLVLTSPRGVGEVVSAAGDTAAALKKTGSMVRTAATPGIYRPVQAATQPGVLPPLPPPSQEYNYVPGQGLVPR